MYGWIIYVIKNYLREKNYKEILKKLENYSFIRHENYENEENYLNIIRKILKEIKEEEKSQKEILEDIGSYYFKTLVSQGYDDLLRCLGSSLFEWLSNINRIHSQLSSVFPKISPPEFYCTPVTLNQLQQQSSLQQLQQQEQQQTQQQSSSLSTLQQNTVNLNSSTYHFNLTTPTNSTQQFLLSDPPEFILHYQSTRVHAADIFNPIICGIVRAVALEYFSLEIASMKQLTTQNVNNSNTTSWKITTNSLNLQRKISSRNYNHIGKSTSTINQPLKCPFSEPSPVAEVRKFSNVSTYSQIPTNLNNNIINNNPNNNNNSNNNNNNTNLNNQSYQQITPSPNCFFPSRSSSFVSILAEDNNNKSNNSNNSNSNNNSNNSSNNNFNYQQDKDIRLQNLSASHITGIIATEETVENLTGMTSSKIATHPHIESNDFEESEYNNTRENSEYCLLGQNSDFSNLSDENLGNGNYDKKPQPQPPRRFSVPGPVKLVPVTPRSGGRPNSFHENNSNSNANTNNSPNSHNSNNNNNNNNNNNDDEDFDNTPSSFNSNNNNNNNNNNNTRESRYMRETCETCKKSTKSTSLLRRLTSCFRSSSSLSSSSSSPSSRQSSPISSPLPLNNKEPRSSFSSFFDSTYAPAGLTYTQVHHLYPFHILFDIHSLQILSYGPGISDYLSITNGSTDELETMDQLFEIQHPKLLSWAILKQQLMNSQQDSIKMLIGNDLTNLPTPTFSTGLVSFILTVQSLKSSLRAPIDRQSKGFPLSGQVLLSPSASSPSNHNYNIITALFLSVPYITSISDILSQGMTLFDFDKYPLALSLMIKSEIMRLETTISHNQEKAASILAEESTTFAKEMENAATKAEEALDVKKIFVRTVSHEIRTPLTVAKMGLSLLEKDIETFISMANSHLISPSSSSNQTVLNSSSSSSTNSSNLTTPTSNGILSNLTTPTNNTIFSAIELHQQQQSQQLQQQQLQRLQYFFQRRLSSIDETTPITDTNDLLTPSINITIDPILQPSEIMKESLLDIKQSIDTAIHILNDLLAYEKLESGILVAYKNIVPVKDYISSCIRPFRCQAIEKNIKLEIIDDKNIDFRFDDGTLLDINNLFLNIDDKKISQVIRNLLSNAIKFTPGDGIVSIKSIYSIDETLSNSNDLKSIIKGSFNSITSTTTTDNNIPDFLDNDNITIDKNNNNNNITTTTNNNNNNIEDQILDINGIKLMIKKVGTLIVQFIDTGAGISSENQQKLFKQIIQITPDKLQGGGGSGLGLWISSGIIDLHGGQIGVSSDGIGFGSTFYFSLPLYVYLKDQQIISLEDAELLKSSITSKQNKINNNNQNETKKLTITTSINDKELKINDSHNTRKTTSIKKSPLAGLRVLIVDDSRAILKVVLRTLTSVGCICDTAEDGEQAIKKFNSERDQMKNNSTQETLLSTTLPTLEPDPYDIILMDNLMHTMNGIEATKKLIELNYKGLIFGATGNVMQDDIQQFLDAGAKEVLAKPLSLEELEKAVRKYL